MKTSFIVSSFGYTKSYLFDHGIIADGGEMFDLIVWHLTENDAAALFSFQILDGLSIYTQST
jgi:hypothetical protein